MPLMVSTGRMIYPVDTINSRDNHVINDDVKHVMSIFTMWDNPQYSHIIEITTHIWILALWHHVAPVNKLKVGERLFVD